MLRLILLLAIAGGLTIFALSNGTALALTFLGMQTPALPLALWVLGAIAAGVATHLLIAALFRLSNLLAAAEVRSQFRRAERRRAAVPRDTPREPVGSPNRSDTDWQDWDGYEQPSSPQPAAKTKIQEPIDDWETGGSDDWEDEPRSAAGRSPKTPPRSNFDPPPNSQPTNPRLGKPETQPTSSKVVDAEFRVIVPPFRPAPEPPPSNADDWFEDDDLETDAERRKRLGL